jgi:hypothetical protein
MPGVALTYFQLRERRIAMKPIRLSLVVFAAWGWSFVQAEAPAPRIQVALLLDTSNSMDGLIDQAKTQLWKIVNEFAVAKRDGKAPELQVALYEYGKSSLPQKEGYIRMIVPLTTDLDKISEELFTLKTNGGDEYCGKVIQHATEGLSWSQANEDLKAIFIAGNEPFTQGDVDYKKSCKAAITKGVTVNTIFCGPYQDGVSTQWKDGADLTDGNYMNIDQNRKAVHIAAPQDVEIARLGAELNKTYLPYGSVGKKGLERQAAQDANAAVAAPGSEVQRSLAKASGQYRNVSWDLIDAVKDGQVKLEEVKKEELPEAMQKMTPEERKAYIESQEKERARIQSQIRELDEARKKHVAEEMKKLSEKGEDTLDAAIIKTIRSQAGKKNYQFESK